MKNNILRLIFLILCQIGIAQTHTTITIKGQVFCDSLRIDYGDVININSKIRAEISKEGFFLIPAKTNDTLIFLGLIFQTKKIVLKQNDFSGKLLKVKLVAAVNKLDEVKIGANKIKPNISSSQEIVDKQYYDDQLSSPQNPIIQPSGTFENNADFVRMYKDFKKLIKKDKATNTDTENQFTFIEIVLNTYNETFFTKSLQIKESDIMLFLMYCDNDPTALKFLQKHTKFELTNFLTIKNDEFKRFTTFEK